MLCSLISGTYLLELLDAELVLLAETLLDLAEGFGLDLGDALGLELLVEHELAHAPQARLALAHFLHREGPRLQFAHFAVADVCL